MARPCFRLAAFASLALAMIGLAGCAPSSSAPPSPASTDEQCRWAVGCQARCAQGYEHYIPYCGGSGGQ